MSLVKWLASFIDVVLVVAFILMPEIVAAITGEDPTISGVMFGIHFVIVGFIVAESFRPIQ